MTVPQEFSALLGPGEPAPWFKACALSGNPDYAFDTTAGRPVLLLFFGVARQANAAAALEVVARNRALFDDSACCFFGVTVDPADAAEGLIRQQIPGIRFFLDYDRAVSRLYGAASAEGERYRPHWLLLDRALRVVGQFAIDSGEEALGALTRLLQAQPDQQAPVLIADGVFEPEFCRRLIEYRHRHGDEESGFMRDVDGKTRLLTDPNHKIRRDCDIGDPELRREIQFRFHQRLKPLVQRAFQFEATRMERYIIGCYDAETGGHFRPHRDNTTAGTAHRRFAVTLNLNAEEYEGGELRFPEFGRRTYRAPTGGVVVFSCSLLHEATKVTRGTRYAFLPFLYDDAAAELRERNNPHLGAEVGQYRAHPKREDVE